MTQQHLLIVDDDASIVEILEFNLRHEGYAVSTAHSAEEALARLAETPADLILLDVMMGGMSGYRMAEQLRRQGLRTPIIFLTARSTENDLLTGFSVGADDYIAKPFSLKEVAARVRAVLGRAAASSQPTQHEDVPRRSFAELEVDVHAREIFLCGQALPLTKTETELLILLTAHPERTLSRAEIIDTVWHQTPFITERTVDVHITRLRKKLGERYAATLVNRQGYGYKFSPAALCD